MCDGGAIRPKIAIFKLETWVCYGAKIFKKIFMLQVSVQIPVDFETLEGKMGQSTGICSDTCRFDVLKMMFKS